MVARIVRDDEVAGSNPVAPTDNLTYASFWTISSFIGLQVISILPYTKVMKLTYITKIIAGILVLVIVAVLVVLFLGKENNRIAKLVTVSSVIPSPVSAVVTVSPVVSPVSTKALSDYVPDMTGKKTGTKSYYSEKLGVGFTYSPSQDGTKSRDQQVVVTEIGNKIFLNLAGQKPEVGQWLEVFTTKEATLPEAITVQFLKGIDPKVCFPKAYVGGAQGFAPANIAPENDYAGISYPAPSDPNAPYWDGGLKCTSYSETNGIQYFVMNKKVPNKFIFVSVGQYSLTDDGVVDQNWTNSIKIVK